jgi:hypothetical protein
MKEKKEIRNISLKIVCQPIGLFGNIIPKKVFSKTDRFVPRIFLSFERHPADQVFPHSISVILVTSS